MGSAAYDIGTSWCVYAAAGEFGGRAVLCDCVSVQSFSVFASSGAVVVAAAEGEVYKDVGVNVGARGHGAHHPGRRCCLPRA